MGKKLKMSVLLETPDRINIQGKEIRWNEGETVGFGYYNGIMCVTNLGQTHGSIKINKFDDSIWDDTFRVTETSDFDNPYYFGRGHLINVGEYFLKVRYDNKIYIKNIIIN